MRVPIRIAIVSVFTGLLMWSWLTPRSEVQVIAHSIDEVESLALSDDELRYRKKEEQLENAGNVYPLKDPPEALVQTPLKVLEKDGVMELADLGILLRKVPFSKPIDNRSSLYFSETEITNAMFSIYLANTGQYRDDAELEAAAKLGVISTASASVHILDRNSLWRNGKIPDGRADHPVTLLTIRQAVEFCRWLTTAAKLSGTFRLPFAEEWLSAAHGTKRKYPWGDDERAYLSKTTRPVKSRLDLRTPEGLFEMWGNVQEFVLSRSDGYGGQVEEREIPFITKWVGESFRFGKQDSESAPPRTKYWGYTHSRKTRSDEWGFRVVFVPNE